MAASIYGDYAPVYDAIGQGRFGAHIAGWTRRWLDACGARGAHVLDLACGTGAAALAFAAAGCAVVGVDQSSAMLRIAQGRARAAGYDITFVEGDIRSLNDDNCSRGFDSSLIAHRSSFDLVTCFADSLNYLTADGDLDRVFAGAAAALGPGGHLVYDLNSEAEYTTWDERDIVTYDGRDYLVYNKLSYEPETRLATGRIVWFVRETKLWWRGEETHTQRAWSDVEVCGALARAGLALVGRFDVGGAEVSESVADVARVVYIARRT
ncbi:MAG: class I SAM-dependent methyltransferase [Roseiflexaceae bacterium]